MIAGVLVAAGVVLLLPELFGRRGHPRRSSTSARQSSSASKRSVTHSRHSPKKNHKKAPQARNGTRKPKPPVQLWEGVRPSYEASRLKRDRAVRGGSISERNDQSEPGRVYLVSKDDVFKVGITSAIASADRINSHRSYGWQLEGVWDTGTLIQARSVERSVLHYWRSELDREPANIVMPQSGVTETAQLSKAEALATKSFVEKQVALTATGSWTLRQVSEVTVGERVVISGTIAGKGRGSLRAAVWKLEIVDGSGPRITAEFSMGAASRAETSPLGSPIEVRGVVQAGGKHLVLANPHFRLPDDKTDSGWEVPQVVTNWQTARSVTGDFLQMLPRQGVVLLSDGCEITVLTQRPPVIAGPGVTLTAHGRFRDRTTFNADSIGVTAIAPRTPVQHPEQH